MDWKNLSMLLLLIWTGNVLAQRSASTGTDSFTWSDADSIAFTKIQLNENGKFELIIDNHHDCTAGYLIYGKGQYTIAEDSVRLFFDSIPTLPSACQLDSTSNDDKLVSIRVQVKDQDGKAMQGLTLAWGTPKKRWGWVGAKFFKQQFDVEVTLNLRKNKGLNFLRVEKDGYFDGIIPLPEKLEKEYFAEVIMRPKPRVKALEYFSNSSKAFALISSCEIQFSNAILLKKIRCPK